MGLVGSHRAEVDAAIAAAKGRVATDVRISRSEAGVLIAVGPGEGGGRLLLIGFDHEAITPIALGENRGHTFVESNVVRSASVVGHWLGAALTLEAERPLGEDAAVLLEAPDGRIVGAARLPADGGA
ncbi:MAG: DUF1223 domain-containing protein [Amaricoccus sp.]